MSAGLRFLSWKMGRRAVAKTGEANYGEGEDDDTNLGYVEFEQFQDLRERERVSYSFSPQILTEHVLLLEA